MFKILIVLLVIGLPPILIGFLIVLKHKVNKYGNMGINAVSDFNLTNEIYRDY